MALSFDASKPTWPTDLQGQLNTYPKITNWTSSGCTWTNSCTAWTSDNYSTPKVKVTEYDKLYVVEVVGAVRLPSKGWKGDFLSIPTYGSDKSHTYFWLNGTTAGGKVDGYFQDGKLSIFNNTDSTNINYYKFYGRGTFTK